MLGASAPSPKATPDVQIVIPVHRNPKVREPVHALLGGNANISLLDAARLPADGLARCGAADFVITDSGGLQEEVTALGKPVIVIRETTERPESRRGRERRLVGTDGDCDRQLGVVAPRRRPGLRRRWRARRTRTATATRRRRSSTCSMPARPIRTFPPQAAGLAGRHGSTRRSSAGAPRAGALDLLGRLPELERRVRSLGGDGERRKAYDYAEITGYALTHLAARAELADDEIAVGRRAADWLVGRVQQRRLAARDGWDSGAVYLFDLGMISTGLQTFGRRFEEERYVATGLELVELLDRELAADLGPVSAYGPRSERTNWSTRGVVHLAKLVQAFLLAGKNEPAARLIDAVRAVQGPDGHMPTDPESDVTMLHPHLYGAEGLWMWGTATDDQDAIDRSRAAVQWVWTHQLQSGGLPRAFGRPEPIEQLDVTSQAVRMALLLGVRTPGVDRAIERLLELARERDGMLCDAVPARLAGRPPEHLGDDVRVTGGGTRGSRRGASALGPARSSTGETAGFPREPPSLSGD